MRWVRWFGGDIEDIGDIRGWGEWNVCVGLIYDVINFFFYLNNGKNGF